MENVLEVRGLRKTYERFLLDNVTFQVHSGRIVGFIGVNGSGKTTTIRMLLHLISKESGEIRFWGNTYEKEDGAIRNRIGIVLDDGYFYRKLTMREMKKIVAPAYSQWNEAEYKQYMERFALDEKQKIESLSKGMKMKFALALALSHNAELLIMDEPASGLDPLIRSQLDAILLDFVGNGKNSVFFSTHVTSDLDKIADDIVFIDKGRMIFQKSKEVLLQENEATTIEEVMMRYINEKK